jgi:hypothetical protein
MSYPDFFDVVESIKVKDPLAQILGVFPNGEYEITYLEVVKAAGHSCPTVAGAYLMASEAVKALYPNERRLVRGNLKVEFAQSLEEGVAGVVGNVISHISGATDKSGFKGLGGQFARHSLMFYGSDIESSGRFTRVDTGKSIEIIYNHSAVPADERMKPLMQKIISGEATSQETDLFGELWQDRVKRIFENADKVIEIAES